MFVATFEAIAEVRSKCARMLATTVLFAAACSGQIGGGGSASGATPRGPGSTGGTGTVMPRPGTGAGGAPGESSAACGAGAVALPWLPSVLTREQYIHAASDLLGFDVRPMTTFSDVGGRKVTVVVSMTPLQVEERLIAAEAIAAEAATPTRLAGLLPCDPAQLDDTCAARFVEGFGQRAFRRKLDPAAVTSLRALFDAGRAAGGAAGGVQWLVAGVLQAPDFLYRLAPGPRAKADGVVPLDPVVLANRLSFFLWNSPPDEVLLAAAIGGDLARPEMLAAQVQRMLGDPRAWRAQEDYHGFFLKLDQLEDVTREAPEFSPALAQGLRASALAGIADLYRSSPTIETLLGSPAVFADDALAGVYGLPAGPGGQGEGLTARGARPTERRGILTHPALLTVLANADSSDPIKRGIFLQEELLCQSLPDALPDVPDLPPLRPGLSTRARLEQHRADPVCAACHDIIDPLGMAFENYDQIGRWRTMDQGVPVDSSGEVRQDNDLRGHFGSGMEFLAKLPTSQAVRDCMALRWAEFAFGRALDAPEPDERCAVEPARDRFRESGDLVELLAAIANGPAFRSTRMSDPLDGGNGP